MLRAYPAPSPADVPIDAAGSRPDRPYRDLCTTCNHAGTCASRRTSGQAVFFCEEFDASVPAASPAAPSRTAGSPKAARPAGRQAGLCVNCQAHEGCALPKPEGGIWHCEEYR